MKLRKLLGKVKKIDLVKLLYVGIKDAYHFGQLETIKYSAKTL